MPVAIASQLRQPSFRGIPFAINDAEMGFGRRNVLHEYPYRDIPYGEDLGRKGREITLNAFLMISDYAIRDQLIAAMEDESTSGTLVHPTLGNLTVIPKDCKHRYNNLEAGIEYFTLVFVEAGTLLQTTAVPDTNGVAMSLAASLKSDAVTFFSSNFKTQDLPNWIANSSIHNLNTFSKAITQAANFAGAANDTTGNFNGFLTQLSAFNKNINTLVYNPADLGQSITDLNAALNAAFQNNLPQATIIQNELWLFGTLLKAITDPTTLGNLSANNQIVLVILVQLSVMAELIIIITNTKFISLNQANSTQDTVAQMGQELLLQLADSFDDEIYLSLKNAVDGMVANVESQSTDLAQVETITIAQNTPALVVAYTQYNDASQDLALVSQNGIVNPGFIPAGTELMVLT